MHEQFGMAAFASVHEGFDGTLTLFTTPSRPSKSEGYGLLLKTDSSQDLEDGESDEETALPTTVRQAREG